MTAPEVLLKDLVRFPEAAIFPKPVELKLELKAFQGLERGIGVHTG